MKAFFITLFLVSCEACQPKPLPVPLSPEPTVDDAGAPLDDCAQGCRHLRRLGCPDGEHTPGGKTCEAVCRASLPPTGGADPKCLKGVQTCDQEATCTVK